MATSRKSKARRIHLNALSRAKEFSGSSWRSAGKPGASDKQQQKGAKLRRPTPAVFYGYPVELIRDWCRVSADTAYLYKIGARRPSRQALHLFVLHRDGRVLGPDWGDWSVHGDVMISPEGKRTTKGQLNAYWLVMQLARDLTEKDPKARQEFYRILASA